jgi:DNA-binding transcriptional ArsR family regulator
MAIFDLLEAIGPASAADIAASIGCAPDRVYYHLRILERVGLVKQLAHRRKGQGAIFDVVGRPTWLHYEPAVAANKRAIVAVVDSMLRDAGRSFRQRFRTSEVFSGLSRTLWAGRRTAWLARSELLQVNRSIRSLTKLIERNRGRKPGARLYSLTFVVSPTGSDLEQHGR